MNTHSSLYNHIEKLRSFFNDFKRVGESSSSYSEKLKSLTPFLDQISLQNCVLVLLWDVVAARFIYVADRRNVVGHDMALYRAEDGMNFSVSNVHADYVFSSFLFQKIAIDYLLKKAEIDTAKIVTNFDALYKKGDGKYMHFLQQTILLDRNESGQPLFFLNYIHDITHFKKERSANLVVTTPSEVKLWNFKFEQQCVEPEQYLSVQEKNVLAYLAIGKHSKEIAEELHISPHTIDTHRRNLLKKTNCIDTTGLVTYARLVGLL